jgi:hypothetical protein
MTDEGESDNTETVLRHGQQLAAEASILKRPQDTITNSVCNHLFVASSPNLLHGVCSCLGTTWYSTIIAHANMIIYIYIYIYILP